MKIQGGEIVKIDHSASGQVVAHVHSSVDGRQFLMPFGLPISLPDIIKAVEGEIASHGFVKDHAERLHAQLSPEINPNPSLPWYRKTWFALSWYFRRHK